MVRVKQGTIDKATAWRIRDALASHPMLGGCTAQINIAADSDGVRLTGWTSDDELKQIASRLALRAAGKRPVHLALQTTRCEVLGW